MICPIKIMKSRRVREGAHSTLDSVLASRPVALGSIPVVPKVFPRKIVNVAEA